MSFVKTVAASSAPLWLGAIGNRIAGTTGTIVFGTTGILVAVFGLKPQSEPAAILLNPGDTPPDERSLGTGEN